MIENRTYADLHCHTAFSDSTAQPEDIATLARAAGLAAVAVTDHDTFSGIKRAAQAGNKLGVKVIPGIEMSSYDYKRNKKVHILAYCCKRPEIIMRICSKTSAERRRIGRIMLERVVRRYHIPEELILRHQSGEALFKQQIMHGLADAGLAASMFGDTYKELFENGKNSIIEPMEYPDVFDALDCVREAGGAAVLAHPALYKSEELMSELVQKGKIDGIEAFHESADKQKSDELVSFAREHGLIITGGSDFHGIHHKHPVPIGSFAADKYNTERLMNINTK